MDIDDFEWELSKENVRRLPGGRSVQLLNKILFTQHTSEFQHKRQQLRQHFELKISQLPASFTKLRLYARYLRWVEQNYPCLGRTADLETLLYRCVRDVGRLNGVQNDRDFVEVWLRLTEYCAQPTELFELLFRQGVGTMCAKFYVTWANLLESKGAFIKTAAVYAHGLRARAEPASWLEDRTESFLARYSAHLENSVDFASCFSNSDERSIPGSGHGYQPESAEPVRQQLAALCLVESRTMNENNTNPSLKVPVLRTSEMWDTHQSGLGSRNTAIRTVSNASGSGLGRRQQPRVLGRSHPQLTTQQRAQSTDSENPLPLLYTLAPVTRLDSACESVDLVRPLTKPSQWQKENCPKPGPWKNMQIDRSKLLPIQPTRQTRAAFEIYSEQDTDASETVTHSPANTSIPQPSAHEKLHKRKGLAMLRGSEDPAGQSQSHAARLTMPMFAVLFSPVSDTSPALPVEQLSVQEKITSERPTGVLGTETPDDVLQQLNLPSLPPGRLPQDATFYSPLHLIYGGADEMCWEMHRAARLFPELAFNAESHRVVTKAPEVDTWLAEEHALLRELELIVEQTEESPKLPEDTAVEFISARTSLIKSLESVVLSAR